jgi:hypothetical protein
VNKRAREAQPVVAPDFAALAKELGRDPLAFDIASFTPGTDTPDPET